MSITERPDDVRDDSSTPRHTGLVDHLGRPYAAVATSPDLIDLRQEAQGSPPTLAEPTPPPPAEPLEDGSSETSVPEGTDDAASTTPTAEDRRSRRHRGPRGRNHRPNRIRMPKALRIRRVRLVSFTILALACWAVVGAALLGACVVVWNVVQRAGYVETLETNVSSALGSEEFTLVGESLLPIAAVGVGAIAALGFVITILLAVVYNAVSFVSGGVALDVGPVRRRLFRRAFAATRRGFQATRRANDRIGRAVQRATSRVRTEVRSRRAASE